MRAVAVRMHDGGDAPTHTPLSRIKGAQAKQKKAQWETTPAGWRRRTAPSDPKLVVDATTRMLRSFFSGGGVKVVDFLPVKATQDHKSNE